MPAVASRAPRRQHIDYILYWVGGGGGAETLYKRHYSLNFECFLFSETRRGRNTLQTSLLG